jgi:hypothetical protein
LKPSSQYEYALYIDESGDPGLVSIRPGDPQGSSEWLVISGVLVRRSMENQVDAWLQEMRRRFVRFKAPDIHFLRLTETNKQIACKYLSTRPIQVFAVCSNKKNMKGYKNPFAEMRSLDKNWYYCWLTRILLERVSHFVLYDSMNKFGQPKAVKLVFSNRGGLSYSQLKAYFELLKLQHRVGGLFLASGQVYFEVIHRDLIEIHPHSALSGLKLADIAASAFFKACDLYHTRGCDTTFASNLKPRVASVEYQGKDDFESYMTFAGYGVKILPSFAGAKLRKEQQEIFRFYGYPRQWWDPTPPTPSPYRMATISPSVASDASDKMPDA